MYTGEIAERAPASTSDGNAHAKWIAPITTLLAIPILALAYQAHLSVASAPPDASLAGLADLLAAALVVLVLAGVLVAWIGHPLRRHMAGRVVGMVGLSWVVALDLLALLAVLR
jgi:hypothetical protein